MNPLLTSIAYVSVLLLSTLSQSFTTRRAESFADLQQHVTHEYEPYTQHMDMAVMFQEEDQNQKSHQSVFPGNRLGGLQIPNQAANAIVHRAPPVNAFYELNIRIPVIGRQIFQLRILSENVAELIIDGMLQVKDVISYRMDQQSGDLSFILSDETERILRKFRTRLGKATYCSETDTPSIVVSPPLPASINLKLERKQ